MLIVVGYHYSDIGVELPNAVNQVLQFVVAQEGLGGDGDQSADVVLCQSKGTKVERKSKSFQLPFFFCCCFFLHQAYTDLFGVLRNAVLGWFHVRF